LYRILAIGGSTTANHHLPVGQRYPTLLEKLLAERYPKREIQVLNAGQNWWTTKNSLINYVSYAETWNPDLVIVMHGINDLGRSFSHPSFSIGEYNDQYTHYYAQASDAAHHTGFEHYMARWVFTKLSGAWFSRLRFREVTFPAEWYRSREPFRRNLERMVHYVRSDGAEVMLVTQPYLYRNSMPLEEKNLLFRNSEFIQGTDSFRTDIASIESLTLAMNVFNATTRDVAEAKGVLLVDAASSIPKDLRYFVDEVHYTPLGARRVAELIADSIVTHGVIDKN
jgi:lysophospholipase L1-like esterase